MGNISIHGRILSVNVGRPVNTAWKGKEVVTGFYKTPVKGRVMVRSTNLDGDGQADLKVHGGKEKAVYAYPAEHYSYWKTEIPEIDFRFGMFGENLTVEGLDETNVHSGDIIEAGGAILKVEMPRFPCYKMNARFGRDDMLLRFLKSKRSGFYLSVIREGELASGDVVRVVEPGEGKGAIIDDFVSFYESKGGAAHWIEREKSWQNG